MLPGPVLARCGPGRSRSMRRSPLPPPPPLALGWLRPPRLHDVERVELVDRGLDAREHGTRARPRACTRALFYGLKIHQLNTDTGATVNAATYATNEPTSQST